MRHPVAAFVVLVTALSACAPGAGTRTVAASAERSPMVVSLPGPADPYAAAVDSAARQGLEVWLESDLLARWLDGPAAFQAAISRLTALASRPGVVGIKIADELGYRDGVAGRPDRALAFLQTADRALGDTVPRARLLVDLYVPELGCGPSPAAPSWVATCRSRARAANPGLALTQIDAVMASGTVDVVDLSTGLRSSQSYSALGTTRDAVQVLAWQEAQRRGWPRQVRLQARKALAHPGRYQGTMAQAEADLHTWVDLPLQHGAAAVDVWTWQQGYRSEIVRLMDPGLVPNVLYTGLVRRRSAGVPLITHLSPSSVEQQLDVDMAALSRAFGAVFIAAGTG